MPAAAAAALLVLLAHSYSPSDYGRYALGMGFTTLLVTFVATGLGFSVLRLYPSTNSNDLAELVASAIAVAAVIAVAFGAAAGAFATVVLQSNSGWLRIVWVSTLLFVPLTVFTVLSEVLRAQLRPMAFGLAQGAYGAFTILACWVAVAVFHASIPGVIGATAIAAALSCLVAVVCIRQRLPISMADFGLSSAKSILIFAIPISLGGIASWTFRLSDRYVLGVFLTSTAVGMFSAGADFAEKLAGLLLTPIILAVQPLTIQTLTQDAIAGTIALRRSIAIYAATAGAVVVVATVGAGWLSRVFLGPRYGGATVLLPILCAAAVIGGLTYIANAVLAVDMKPRLIALLQAAAAIIKLLLNFAVIPRFGLLGASLVTLALNVALVVALTTQVGHGFRRALLGRFPIAVLLATVTISLAIAPFAQLSSPNPKLEAPIAITIAAFCLYCLAVGGWVVGCRLADGRFGRTHT